MTYNTIKVSTGDYGRGFLELGTRGSPLFDFSELFATNRGRFLSKLPLGIIQLKRLCGAEGFPPAEPG